MAKKKSTYRPAEFDDVDERPSRSQLKRDMTALQKLGTDLAALGETVVKGAGLPPEVEKALLLIKSMSKHEASRRHMQYVGKLMRTFDTTHVQEIVDAAQQGHSLRTAEFHRLEVLRDRLVDGDDDLLQALFEANPDHGQRLRHITLSARREKDSGRPLKESRALFKLLRGLPSIPEK